MLLLAMAISLLLPSDAGLPRRIEAFRADRVAGRPMPPDADLLALLEAWDGILLAEGCVRPSAYADAPSWLAGDLREARSMLAGGAPGLHERLLQVAARLDAITARWFADGSVGNSRGDDWIEPELNGIAAIASGVRLDLRLPGIGAWPVEASWHAGGILRLRGPRPGRYPAAVPAPLAVQALAEGDRWRGGGIELAVRRRPLRLDVIAGGRMQASDLRISVLRRDGQVAAVRLRVAVDAAARIFGTGERFGPLDQRGRVVTNWVSDAIISHVDQVWSELYKPVPFFATGDGLGLWADMTGHARLDLGAVAPGALDLVWRGPVCDWWFIGADDPVSALRGYHALTGTPVRPPDWAFLPWMGGGTGHWKRDGEAASHGHVRAVVARMEQERLPLGGPIYIEGVPCHGPAGRELLSWLQDRGWKPLNWFGPQADPATPAWGVPAAGWAERFLRHADGGIFRVPAERFLAGSGYLDFTHPGIDAVLDARYAAVIRDGLAGVMVDGGEEVPEDVRASDGTPGVELHNAYGLAYHRAHARLFQRLRPGDHVVFGRTGTTGCQAVCQFAGDLPASWEGLRAAIRGGQSAAASGLAMWGSDIGGYFLDHGAPLQSEVYLRWAAFAAMSPLMRVHGETDREPWQFGPEPLADFRRLAWWRVALQPYLAACAARAHADGSPMMLPVAMAWPQMADAAGIEDEYLLGPALLATPLCRPGGRRSVWLPPGRWRRLDPPGPPLDGPQRLDIAADPGCLPLWLRDGHILPLALGPDEAPGTPIRDRSALRLVVAPDAAGDCAPLALSGGGRVLCRAWSLVLDGGGAQVAAADGQQRIVHPGGGQAVRLNR